MKLILSLITLSVYLAQISGLQVWPKPQEIHVQPVLLAVDPGRFTFSGDVQSCDIIKAAIARYNDIIFKTSRRNVQGLSYKIESNYKKLHKANGTLKSLKIDFNGNCEKWPGATMDETYELKIATPDIDKSVGLLISKSPWGILRGLETFSQLMNYVGGSEFQMNGVQIMDFPRFHHRGFMLDSSRHFLSKQVIKQNIDLMAYSKLNVFHWHIVDDQSFPYQSRMFPDLSYYGAYNPTSHVYTPSDVQEIIEYARMRGVRVIPEFDTPGHTQSWGKGMKKLLTPCYNTKTGEINGYYAMNPILNSTYTFLKDFFGEVVQTFPDQYIHLGGDEVSFGCWNSNPDLKKFMKAHNLTGPAELEDYYEQKLVDIIKSFPGDHQYLVWEEVFVNGVKLKPESIVHVWKGGYKSTLAKSTAAGFRTLLSSCWYLNYISYGEDWPKFYKCDPQDFEGTAKQKELIMGGEVCMWGEYVDGTNVVSRSWPRASVPAERLWSNKNVTDVNDANMRLNTFRCSLLRRGYNVEPPTGPGFCPDDYLV